MIITGNSVDGITDLKASIHYHFEMKDLGSPSHFLSLEVISSNDSVYLSQVKYAYDLLAEVGMTNSQIKSIPLKPNVRFTPMDGIALDDLILYEQLFLSAPHTTHFAAILQIRRYIKGTMFQDLRFSA
ncbi:uncharacterized mitochondrial protein AtMg00810-like [Arachis stenosperma]|uniref:uncharacterized mitochondrial protein AtMg00810-like n=1 Tax=Arachis stenosperma TaxID=217475 RepID=UPI0025ACE1E7|nr:uncharacterized mitochondrial protein AtMg00810-like [Arachis stenosperma]